MRVRILKLIWRIIVGTIWRNVLAEVDPRRKSWKRRWRRKERREGGGEGKEKEKLVLGSASWWNCAITN